MGSPPFSSAPRIPRPGTGSGGGRARKIRHTDFSLARRLFFFALITSLTATAGLAILILLFAEFDDTAGRILATTALLSLASLLSLPAGVLLDQGRYGWLAWALLALSAAGFALAMVLVWGPYGEEGDDWIWKLLTTVAAFAGACSQTAATTARRRAEDARRVRGLYAGAVVLALLFASLVAVAAWAEIDREGYYRLLAAVAVADLLVVLLQPIVRRLERAQAAAPAARGEREVYRFLCAVDALPASLPDGYSARAGDSAVECRVGGVDFAAAVAEAIRTLERTGARVERVERLG